VGWARKRGTAVIRCTTRETHLFTGKKPGNHRRGNAKGTARTTLPQPGAKSLANQAPQRDNSKKALAHHNRKRGKKGTCPKREPNAEQSGRRRRNGKGNRTKIKRRSLAKFRKEEATGTSRTGQREQKLAWSSDSRK